MQPEVVALRPVLGREQDLAVCRRILANGSKSFAAASWLLPERVRAPAAAFYAFCRVADDAIDLSLEPQRELERLHARLDRLFSGRPDDDPVDRALCNVISEHALPRPIFDALLEGFAWDAEGRSYDTMRDVFAYSVRVASTVGMVMTVLMGRRDAATLARACDLGVAMQLTNIARDVGEDARRGRVYLPLAWLEAHEVPRRCLISEPAFDPRLGEVVRRVLDEADALYRRAESGIAALPSDCRPAIFAARLIYGDIGRVVRRRRFDSVSRRARTGLLRKLWLLGRAWSKKRYPTDALDEVPLAEARFLIASVSDAAPSPPT